MVAATLSATASVLAPGWREMLMSAAGRPSPATTLTRSSVPSCTVATSRTRTPGRTATFPTSSGV